MQREGPEYALATIFFTSWLMSMNGTVTVELSFIKAGPDPGSQTLNPQLRNLNSQLDPPYRGTLPIRKHPTPRTPLGF